MVNEAPRAESRELDDAERRRQMPAVTSCTAKVARHDQNERAQKGPEAHPPPDDVDVHRASDHAEEDGAESRSQQRLGTARRRGARRIVGGVGGQRGARLRAKKDRVPTRSGARSCAARGPAIGALIYAAGIIGRLLQKGQPMMTMAMVVGVEAIREAARAGVARVRPSCVVVWRCSSRTTCADADVGASRLVFHGKAYSSTVQCQS